MIELIFHQNSYLIVVVPSMATLVTLGSVPTIVFPNCNVPSCFRSSAFTTFETTISYLSFAFVPDPVDVALTEPPGNLQPLPPQQTQILQSPLQAGTTLQFQSQLQSQPKRGILSPEELQAQLGQRYVLLSINCKIDVPL